MLMQLLEMNAYSCQTCWTRGEHTWAYHLIPGLIFFSGKL